MAQFADWLDQPASENSGWQTTPTIAKCEPTITGYIAGSTSSRSTMLRPTSSTPAQMTWLQNLLQRDSKDASVRALVLGMHAAFPESWPRDIA